MAGGTTIGALLHPIDNYHISSPANNGRTTADPEGMGCHTHARKGRAEDLKRHGPIPRFRYRLVVDGVEAKMTYSRAGEGRLSYRFELRRGEATLA
jgi:hypothetical protein